MQGCFTCHNKQWETVSRETMIEYAYWYSHNDYFLIDDIQNLKGNTIEVFIDNDHVKEILVTDVFKNSEGKILIQSSEGKIYSEEDINWNYSLTLGGCLMAWLLKNNYVSDKDIFKYDGKYYENQLRDLFNTLIKQGYIKESE